MESEKPGRWKRLANRWRVFAEAYFGPWVVRALSLMVALYLALEFFEGFVSTVGIPFIEAKEWFPITKHIPPGVVPWSLAGIFFLMSLAIAQQVSARLMVASAERDRDMAGLRLEMKEIEMRLNAETAKAKLSAEQQAPSKETASRLEAAEDERDKLRSRVAEMAEKNASISSEERITLAKGYLRRAVDDLRDALQSGDETSSAARAAINAGQLVLHHDDQNEWHKNFRDLRRSELLKRLPFLDEFVDSLIIERLRDFARGDLKAPAPTFLLPG